MPSPSLLLDSYTTVELAQSGLFEIHVGGRSMVRALLLALGDLGLEVLAAELDQVLGVASDDLLAEVFEDSGELLGDLDLVSRENSHFANVCHLL
jgi:hypothetical protein